MCVCVPFFVVCRHRYRDCDRLKKDESLSFRTRGEENQDMFLEREETDARERPGEGGSRVLAKHVHASAHTGNGESFARPAKVSQSISRTCTCDKCITKQQL